MKRPVRVRFAPSPTGGLHLGGVRTALYNYLFAKKHGGTFVLRIEDTDQTRYVPGAEEYIVQCLEWCGLMPDESPLTGGPHGPYRQSERKQLYAQYAQQLVDAGYAYYAFDTPEELAQMKAAQANAQYDHTTRGKMRNSLSLPAAEVKALLDQGTPYVIRIKMPESGTVQFTDVIRGEISFDAGLVDDKVLLKADGMPTYHLAVVVDDYLMQISHAFRGEEWLPSAPVHVLLWEYLGWKDQMPEWAHLPLILKPDGHGKLSKRDGQRLGFPVCALDWTDPNTGETSPGFRERGFLPGAFINMLAMLGWNDGTTQELFSLEELIAAFSLERVHKAGARFDYEKAKWFNHQFIQQTDDNTLTQMVQPFLAQQGVQAGEARIAQVVPLIKERCSLLTDFYEQGHFFFKSPEQIDMQAIRDKWKEPVKQFFQEWVSELESLESWSGEKAEESFNALLAARQLKKGEVLLPLRIMLVGGKYGPGVFQIAEVIGKEETRSRVLQGIKLVEAQG
jgi:glutamyl-tRNA synthetase